MLLEQTIQILQFGARAQRNALFARAVQQVRVTALGGGHGVDNGLHAFEHFGVDLGLGLLRHLPHARQFIEHAGNAAHVLHLLELVFQVFQIELFALLDLFGKLLGLFLVELLLRFFNQRQHIAHAENARGNSIRIKGFQGIGFLAHTQKFNGLAGNVLDREGRTTAGVRIRLGQHHTGQRQRLTEGLGGVRRILTGHGINHEQGLNRLDGAVQLLDFRHHGFINREATGGIDDQHVMEPQLRLSQRRIGNIHRLLGIGAGEEGCAYFSGEGFKLLDGRRTVNVGADHHHLFLFFFLQIARKFGHRGGFTCTLQTGHQNDRRRLGGEVEGLGLRTHNLFQLFLNNFNKLLTRTQALADLLAYRPLTDDVDKVFHHRQGYIGFQQGLAHLAHGVLDVVLSQARLPGYRAQGGG